MEAHLVQAVNTRSYGSTQAWAELNREFANVFRPVRRASDSVRTTARRVVREMIAGGASMDQIRHAFTRVLQYHKLCGEATDASDSNFVMRSDDFVADVLQTAADEGRRLLA